MLGLMATAVAVAQEEPKEAAGVPGVEAVLDERVGKAPAAEAPAVPKGVTMAVTAANGEAQDAVRHGMTSLHAGWDFEAYRHFCEALKADPDCLMAHWGVVMALLQADFDLVEEREAAVVRMRALVDAGVGSDIERRYVFGTTKLLTAGAPEAANAFAAAVEAYPKDPQMRLLRCLLGRSGYDETGTITPDQERAEKEMRETIAEYPELPWLRHALLAMRAEAPDLTQDLGMARGLVKEAPDYPPYWHLLGHYEWRCGNHGRATVAFAKASELYTRWMEKNGFTALDCPQWTRSECYRAAALSSRGDYATALKIAKAVAAVPVPPERVATNGGRMLVWEGRTLPVRILMRRYGAGDMSGAQKLLPPREEVAALGDKSLVGWAYQAYSTLLGARLALEQDKLEEAMVLANELTRLGESFVKTRQAAVGIGERSEWLRFFKALEVMASETRGLVAMKHASGPSVSAAGWFQSAADRQARATLMMPPSVLMPMEVRLGQYYMAVENWEKAVEVLMKGASRWPGDWEVVNSLQIAFSEAGMKEHAADAARQLEEMQQEE